MKVKNHFTSRWGSEGILIEADWSSLEIIAWAMHNKDPQLCKLIRSGQDMHRFVGAGVLGCRPEDVTDEQRTKLKPANFTLIYGGTDWNLVTKDGLEPKFAKEVYDTFWNLFPVARLYADNLMKELDANAKPSGPNGQMKSYYRGLTGRKYWFKNYPEKISGFCAENRIYTLKGFKYSEGMNYRIQGFATADLHMIALGMLFRESIKHRDKFVLINTVHDSVIVDCKKEFQGEACNIIKTVLESVVQKLNNKFEIKCDLPISVELKCGNSWGNMIKIKEV